MIFNYIYFFIGYANILDWAVKYCHNNHDNLVTCGISFLRIAVISGGDELIGLVFAWRVSEEERFLQTMLSARKKKRPSNTR